MSNDHPTGLDRRHFLATVAAAGAGSALAGSLGAEEEQPKKEELPTLDDPDAAFTNISEALGQPRGPWAMPGRHPGVVVEVSHPAAITDDGPDAAVAAAMVAAGMNALTGAEDARDAWASLFEPKDRIGIKINNVGGKVSGTTHEVTAAVVDALVEIGVPRGNLVFWEHYEKGLLDWGWSEERYPGTRQECHQYTVGDGDEAVAKGLDRLDTEVYWECDFVIPDEQNYMDYMVNGGSKSFYPQVLTEGVDKVVNIPSLKHHQLSYVTLAMKNLAFGALSNCMRGHELVHRFTAETCAFPPLRDTVVLNITDGLRGQYDKGPGPSPRHVWPANTLLVATDPVAVDAVGFELIAEKRVAEGIESAEEAEQARAKHDFLVRAENLGLGVQRADRIDRRRVVLA